MAPNFKVVEVQPNDWSKSIYPLRYQEKLHTEDLK